MPYASAGVRELWFGASSVHSSPKRACDDLLAALGRA
jgi:hypothetical protein